MTAHALAATLGLYAEPHGDGGCWRLLSEKQVPLFILEPRAAVGGERRWRLVPCLDLATVAKERAA